MGFIRQPLGDRAQFIGDDGNRAQVIRDKIIRVVGRIRNRIVLADPLAASRAPLVEAASEN